MLSPSDTKFKEQAPLYDLSRFGIGGSNNTKPSDVSNINVPSDVSNNIPNINPQSIQTLQGAASAVGALNGTIQTFFSTIGAGEELTEFFGVIGEGTSKLSQLGSVVSTVTQLSGMFKAAQVAQAAATSAGIAPTMGAVAAQSTLAVANADVAVTGAAASVSWIPIVGIGLAIAGVIAMVAMLAGSRKKGAKMAQGGIVPAGYSNDSYPAMLTSGEMVIPPVKLPDFKRKKEKVHVMVEGKIKGQDIYYVMKEVGRKHSNSY